MPGGGIALDGSRWLSSRPAFLLPVRVLGKLFLRLFLTRMTPSMTQASSPSTVHDQSCRPSNLPAAPGAGKTRCVVYAKPPFAGPEAVLAYLARYTRRVAISNRRLLAFDENGDG